ncbi:MAG TPA: hypothetical protein VFN59_07055 [Acidimicrobiales bacterium]|nr:hypothetical protein [Acidimicrobiales bacterium]
MDPTLQSPARFTRPAHSTWITAAYLATYLVLACLIFWPATPWNNTRLPSVPYGGFGYGDPAQMAWYLKWTPYAILHGLNPLHTNFVDYPTGANLASNTSSPFLGILATPISLTLGPVAAFNILLRLAFATSAGSMFLVLRTWCRRSIAFVGGLVYGFGPYVVTQSTHLNLAFIPLLPPIVWILYELLSAQKHKPHALGLWLGVFVGLQVLIDPEPIALLAAVVGPLLVLFAILERHRLADRFIPLLSALPYAVVLIVVLDGVYVWWMLFGPVHVNGAPLPVPYLQSLSSDLLTPLVPTLNQYVLPSKLVPVASRFVNGNFTENCGYLGVGFISWVVIVATRFRGNRVVLYSALASLWALVLSLGPRLVVDAHVTSVPLPEDLLYRLPLMDHVVPARFALIVTLFAVIAAATGAECYVRRLSQSTIRTRKTDEVAMTVIAGAALLLLVPQVALVTKAPNWPSTVGRALAVVPPDAVVLTYPYPLGIYTESMSWQAQDNFAFRLIGGYINLPSPQGHGQAFAYPLEPAGVQSFLVTALDRTSNPYGPPSSAIVEAHELCTFVHRYHVGALVYWRTGAHPERVRQLFEHDFGRPSASVSRGSIEVWRTPPGSCAAG